MTTHYFFGEYKEMEGAPTPEEIDGLILQGTNAIQGEHIHFSDVLDIFSKLHKAWSDPQYAIRITALEEMKKSAGLGAEMIETIFEHFPKILDPQTIERKLEREFGSSKAFSELYKKENGNLSYIVRPSGMVLHVAAGNAFLNTIDSLINGIITLNVNFVKMSDPDRIFPILFMRSLEEFDTKKILTKRIALLWWKGGDSIIENKFKQHMDRIIFWGGSMALASWQKDLSEKTILIPHGPKVSFGVVSRQSLKENTISDITDALAFDISIWEQKACNCPQTVFVEHLDSKEGSDFLESLAISLEKTSVMFPPPEKTRDEYAELIKARELAIAGSCLDEKNTVYANGNNWQIIAKYTANNELIYSPLNRTVYIQSYENIEAIALQLKQSYLYLQTTGYSLSTAEIPYYAELLSSSGVTRICPFGTMTIPEAGSPHDGKYLLPDLSRITVLETEKK